MSLRLSQLVRRSRLSVGGSTDLNVGDMFINIDGLSISVIKIEKDICHV